MTAIEQVKAEIDDAIRELSSCIGKDYSFALDDIRDHLYRATNALRLLTAPPPAVAALPGKWREEANSLRVHAEGQRRTEAARTICIAYTNEKRADELDAALKGDG